ncbi:MAG: alpha/beta fold hydrolase [Spirosomaceae bacterium]|jgi:hypothetical protein|nr:alpha/beta fold hydrolase [Spirosomataceae bacterium]
MKYALSILFFTFFASLSISAQEITGQWTGTLKVPGGQLRLVFNIAKTDNEYKTTMDSPDQGAKGIPVTTTIFENPKLTLAIPAGQIEYTGQWQENTITGTFKQRGMSFPLDLTRSTTTSVQANIRPQEPQKPYPYLSEDVTFVNPQANITLAGTLTLPHKDGVFPAVILISGSGAQNRDEELLGHKPFLVISDYFTRRGIAVLRYDDRGTAQSKGNFKTATSHDFATDVESAISYLKTRKEIGKIGLVGHSEGGMIAPMVAARDKRVAFIVLMAGTGIRGDQLLLLQQELIARANGVSEKDIQISKELNTKAFEMVSQAKNEEQLKKDLSDFLLKTLRENPDSPKPKDIKEEDFVAAQVNQIINPWMLYFLKYDPAVSLSKVKCPVLAVNGEKDTQVPARVNLEAIENHLKKAKNKDVTTKAYSSLNHLFQEAQTGSPTEYTTIQQTFSPTVMEDMTQWMLARTKGGN